MKATRLLGIDYGERRVGLALSDDKGMMAFPKAVFPNNNFLMTDLRDFIKGHSVEKIIVGVSKSYAMKDNLIMDKIRPFVEELRRDTGLEVIYESELLTSHQAAHFQGKTDMIDAAAASIILQSYIDRT